MPPASPASPASPDDTVTEQTIAELVERFYDRARRDALLAPIFDVAIHDWDGHLAIIRDFWVRHLIGAPHGSGGHGGGGGGMFMVHAVLPLQPAHFDRWLALFRETAAEILPPPLVERAMKRAEHTAASLKAGMFTVPGHRFAGPRS